MIDTLLFPEIWNNIAFVETRNVKGEIEDCSIAVYKRRFLNDSFEQSR